MATFQNLSQLCLACARLKTSALLKLPSISLRRNHQGLEDAERLQAIIANLPIFLPLPVSGSYCPVCQLIRKQLDGCVTQPGGPISIYKCENLEGGIETLFLYLSFQEEAFMEITVYADEDTWAAEYLPFRPFQSAGSMKSVQDIQNWLAECDTEHLRCCYSISGKRVESESPLPTRIIDVGSLEASTVRLLIPINQTSRYVSLSHCWGGQSLCRTTQKNLEQHKESIVVSDLTRTLQDAVQLVRRLGLRYLWVDSLCILQDDEEDWLREAGRMAAVYEGSYLTIAASASKDGSGGCFVNQETQSLIRVPCDTNDASTGHMYFGVRKYDDPARQLFDGPLNKRSWVLQEHLFARRTVHFAEDQIYWECDKHLIGQDRSDGRGGVELSVPTRSLLICVLGDLLGPEYMPLQVESPPEDKFDRADYYSWWANLVKFFSNCGLTKASDRLPALLSLSLELGKLTNDEYHEGHWLWEQTSYMFMSTLLWHSNDKHHLKKLAQFRAPSWSWAALDGSLDFADMTVAYLTRFFHPEPTDLSLLRVQLYQPVGLPARKSLLLSGVLIRVRTKQDCSKSFPLMSDECMCCEKSKKLICVRVNNEAGEEIAGGFTFDTAENELAEFWLLPVFTRWVDRRRKAPVYYALLVAEVPRQKAPGIVFERIGVGHIEDARLVFGFEKRFLVLI